MSNVKQQQSLELSKHNLLYTNKTALCLSFYSNPNIFQSCRGEDEDFCEFLENYPEDNIRQTIRENTSLMEQKLLFSKLENSEKTLVRSRLLNRGNAGEVASGITFKPASNKLESNLINETPLCDVIESFVYPRIVQSSLIEMPIIY